MCGIYATNIPYSNKDVETKLKSIDFRGPDNMGMTRMDFVTLGHLRLSILDLDPRSNQPMTFDDLHITFNGEIYNYLELKVELEKLGHTFKTTSDTEVLLRGYRQWGKDLLHKINGMFAFVIYDAECQRIFGARDRLGVKPFYYYQKNNVFEICSQLRPLINEKSQINEEAISIYLACGYIPSPYSAIRDVHKLPPGCYMVIDLSKNELIIKNYWDLQKVVVSKKTYAETKNELHELIKDAVRIRLQSDVPLGSFLSGGIDSALVTAVATELSERKVNTYSIGFENEHYDESKVAEQYARILGTNHKTIICKIEDILDLIPWHTYVYDEPFADSSALPSLLLNKVTKEHVTVALSGDGGDESFLGYNYFRFLKQNQILFRIPSWGRLLIVRLKLINLIRKILKKSIPEELFLLKDLDDYIIYHFTGGHNLQKERQTNWLTNYEGFKNHSKPFLQRAADFNIKLWLENDSNVKVDRASMGYSVEVRSPFLDYRIVEMARSTPLGFRYKGKIRKRILRDILKQYIPEEVFNQPKKGFSVPIGNWIRNELKEEFHSKLSDDFLCQIPNLDIKKFKEEFNAHMYNRTDFATNIWKLYVLRKWYEEFGFYKADIQ